MPNRAKSTTLRKLPSAEHRHRRQGLAPLRDVVGVNEEAWPYFVSAVVGVAGAAVATCVGAAEIAVGVAAAYAAYNVVARGFRSGMLSTRPRKRCGALSRTRRKDSRHR